MTYLRHVEDPYGSRIISFNPTYSANPYIRAAGFTDSEAWPELTQPESPKPVESVLAPATSTSQLDTFVNGRMRENDDAVAPEAGVYPGANLKYSDTIMGPSRTGLAGMRVSGRRLSSNNRGTPVRSVTALSEHQTRFRSDSAPTPAPGSANPLSSHMLAEPGPVAALTSSEDVHSSRRDSGGSAYRGAISSPTEPAASNGSTPTATVSGSSRLGSDTIAPAQTQSPQPAPTSMVALPVFARAAEMEERRRLRMRARFAPQAPVSTLSPPSADIGQASQSSRSAPRRAADTLSLAGTIDSRTSREEDASGTIDGEGGGGVTLEDSDSDDTDEDADGDADADPDDMDAEMAESGDQDDLSMLFNP